MMLKNKTYWLRYTSVEWSHPVKVGISWLEKAAMCCSGYTGPGLKLEFTSYT